MERVRRWHLQASVRERAFDWQDHRQSGRSVGASSRPLGSAGFELTASAGWQDRRRSSGLRPVLHRYSTYRSRARTRPTASG